MWFLITYLTSYVLVTCCEIKTKQVHDHWSFTCVWKSQACINPLICIWTGRICWFVHTKISLYNTTPSSYGVKVTPVTHGWSLLGCWTYNTLSTTWDEIFKAWLLKHRTADCPHVSLTSMHTCVHTHTYTSILLIKCYSVVVVNAEKTYSDNN